MSKYETHCAWCGKELHGEYVTWLPAFEDDPESDRYCSRECVTERRADLFHRSKRPSEKWPRFSVEVPPELAATLDAAQRKSLGANVNSASRAGITRAALRMYLDASAPMPDPAIEGEATEVELRREIAHLQNEITYLTTGEEVDD